MENEVTDQTGENGEAAIEAAREAATDAPADTTETEVDTAAQDALQSAKATVKAAVEAIVYVTEEPVTVDQIVAALTGSQGAAAAEMKKYVMEALSALQAECAKN